MSDSKDLALACKTRGNSLFSSGDYGGAISAFSEGIEHDPSNHVLFSNRSAARASAKDYQGALSDAEKTVALKPDWAKGYSRLGSALEFLNRMDEAKEAYMKGLEIDPENGPLKDGLRGIEARESATAAQANPLAQMFSDPSAIVKLAANPKTKEHLSDPEFLQKLQMISQNPSAIGTMLQDPRIADCLGVLMGIDLSSAAPGSGSSADDESIKRREEEEKKRKEEEEKKRKEEEEKAAAEAEANLSDEEKERRAKLAAAMELKAKGNEKYKAKEFQDAVKFYTEAIDTYPAEISFYLNRAAVHLEAGSYNECVEDCSKAVEVGRENRAEYKLIARALDRKGKAYLKLDNLDAAIDAFEHSLTEARSGDVLTRLKDTQKLRKKRIAEAYIDPVKAEEERQAGNELFKTGEYPGALERYREALKRSPNNAKVLSNMSACYQKLGAFPDALKHADLAIEADPAFVKGYSRKGHSHFSLKEYHKAMSAYQDGLKIDPENTELKEGLQRTVIKVNTAAATETDEERKARAERSMADPEIRQILQDPMMQKVLQDMGQDPNAARAHLSDPSIAEKIEKLIAAGVVSVG